MASQRDIVALRETKRRYAKRSLLTCIGLHGLINYARRPGVMSHLRSANLTSSKHI